MDSKLQVFDQKLDQNNAESFDSTVENETVKQIQNDSATDWSCWVDAGWGNGCIIA